MKYDYVGVVGFFIVISIWSFVLTSIISRLISSDNVIVNRDIDLVAPTLVIFGINLVYLCLSIFMYIFYLVKYDQVKDRHVKMLARKVLLFNNNCDLCSIIIPAHNEESVIRKAVLGCLQQTYSNIEVIVVCHNSTDRTFEEAQVQDPRVNLLDLRTIEAGKSIALNYGVEHSRGKYILVLDADHELNKDFIEKARPGFDESCAAVQGSVHPINRNYNFVTKMLSLEDDLWSDPIMTIRTLLGRRCPLLGSGFMIKKHVLIEVGGFGKSLVEDYELSFRLYRKKYRIQFVPLCIVSGEHPPTLQIMLRQRARWAKGFIDLLSQRIAEPTDLLGNLYWIAPIGSMSGTIMLSLVAYAWIFNALFGYLPYAFSYTYMHMVYLHAWILIMVLTLTSHILVLIKRHGRQGFRYALYLIPYITFSQYAVVVLFKAFFVRSWSTTKTTHGFIAPKSDTTIVR